MQSYKCRKRHREKSDRRTYLANCLASPQECEITLPPEWTVHSTFRRAVPRAQIGARMSASTHERPTTAVQATVAVQGSCRDLDSRVKPEPNIRATLMRSIDDHA